MNWKALASIGMVIITIAGIVFYDQVYKEKVLSTEVVVAKNNINKHSEFNKSNLVVERRKKSDLVKGYIKPSEVSKLYGKDANTAILKNQVISDEYVDIENLTPDPSKNEAIRPIPSEWIYAMPGSLRRKDIITIYPVKPIEKTVNMPPSINTVDDNNVVLTEEDAKNVSPTEVANRFKPILKNVPVIYVKTSQNQEVTNKKGSDPRLNASGTANDIEVNLTDDQLKKIVEYIDQGYKLYISYI